MLDLLGRLKRTEHHFCQENLSSYIDGELPARAQERVRRHLEECEGCRRELDSLQQTVALLRAMPKPKPPRSFAIPESTPAPFVPFWMRPGAYTALRTATAAVAAVFVITVAGNALATPALSKAPAGAVPAAAYESTTDSGQATELVAKSAEGLANGTPAAAAAPSAGALPNDTPVAQTWAAPFGASPLPTTAGVYTPAYGEPTLTAEEATRRAAAPPGMGGGLEPQGTPAPPGALATPGQAEPTPAPEVIALGTGAPGEPTPTPEEVARALGGEHPAQPTARAGETIGERGQPLPATTAAHDTAQPATDALWEARQRLARYPWPALTIVAAAVLAVLTAATLWLRAVRSRWP